MEPPSGFCSSLWQLVRFLPFFIGLLLLGSIKGIIFCPLICLIVTVGNTAIILGLLPVHFYWTYDSVLRAKQFGVILKIVLCPFLFILLVIWPAVGITMSVVGGLAYGFLSPVFATFDAVGEGKSNELINCIVDGTWSSVRGGLTVVRDFKDVCFHSYFSYMNDLRDQGLPSGQIYEIRIIYTPGAIVAMTLGIVVDLPVISAIASFKSPYMLFKGWKRLLLDLIGREGPFLETICVPFAGLAILLWPLAVVGALLGSIVAGVFLGAYAGVVAYQESSLWMGLRYIIASLAIYDEYSNDVLDMQEGSCFPRPSYRKDYCPSRTLSHSSSFSGPSPSESPLARNVSLKGSMAELKTLELFDGIFKELQYYAETMVVKGEITLKDVEDAKSTKSGNSSVISVGLPAYCILQSLFRSAKANSPGILLSDGVTQITSTKRPTETFLGWFLNPLLIIKEQIKADNLSAEEEEYLSQSVLFDGNSERFRNSFTGTIPLSEVRRAELDALSRRLRGITKSISRYPTYRRRYETLLKTILEELPNNRYNNKQELLLKKNGRRSLSSDETPRSKKKGLVRRWSEKSLGRKLSSNKNDSDEELSVNHSLNDSSERDVEIQ